MVTRLVDILVINRLTDTGNTLYNFVFHFTQPFNAERGVVGKYFSLSFCEHSGKEKKKHL